MKKFGFTLAEILVALSIIGVLAATSTPLISGIMPDKNKLTVLKVYKVVTDINETLLDDYTLYFKDEDNTTLLGFDRTQQPTIEPYNSELYEGYSKYQALLAAHLKIRSSNLVAGSNGSFVTEDGINWTFTGPRAFTIDINPAGKNCSFGKNCQTPDQFSFVTNANGVVVGNDPLTKAYLANPFKLNNRKADYAKAKSDSSYK